MVLVSLPWISEFYEDKTEYILYIPQPEQAMGITPINRPENYCWMTEKMK